MTLQAIPSVLLLLIHRTYQEPLSRVLPQFGLGISLSAETLLIMRRGMLKGKTFVLWSSWCTDPYRVFPNPRVWPVQWDLCLIPEA
jgi:hypothetical protein